MRSDICNEEFKNYSEKLMYELGNLSVYADSLQDNDLKTQAKAACEYAIELAVRVIGAHYSAKALWEKDCGEQHATEWMHDVFNKKENDK